MIYQFADCQLDLERLEFRRAGRLVPLEPQVFGVLAYLLEHRERVVSKDELLDHVWGHRFVGDAALVSRIMAARKAVGDSGREQRLIKTLHGRGYRFVGEVTPTVPRAVAGRCSAPPVPSPAPRRRSIAAGTLTFLVADPERAAPPRGVPGRPPGGPGPLPRPPPPGRGRARRAGAGGGGGRRLRRLRPPHGRRRRGPGGPARPAPGGLGGGRAARAPAGPDGPAHRGGRPGGRAGRRPTTAPGWRARPTPVRCCSRRPRPRWCAPPSRRGPPCVTWGPTGWRTGGPPSASTSSSRPRSPAPFRPSAARPAGRTTCPAP